MLSLALAQPATAAPVPIRAPVPAPGQALAGDPPPSAPENLIATAVDPSRIDLAWDPVADAVGGVEEYRIYRDRDFIDSSESESYADTGLEPGTTYRYQVSAVDAKQREGKRSRAASATTFQEGDDDDEEQEDETAPTAPQNLQAEAAGPRLVNLDWDAASDPESEIEEYLIYRDGIEIDHVDDETTAYADDEVEPETSYTYAVTAVNDEDLESPPSNSVTVVTPGESDATPPSAPNNLAASAASSTEVHLTWNQASDPESGIAEYRIYRDGTQVGSSPGTSFDDTGLQPDTEYTYEVSAVNGDGLEGPRSAPATVTTPPEGDPSAPSRPRNLEAAVLGPTEVRLAWEAADDPQSGISEYRIYRDGDRVAAVNGTTFTDSGLLPAIEYTYEVSAVNGAGVEGDRSRSETVTTAVLPDASPPTPPQNLTATPAGPRQIDLAWEPAEDPESGIDEYKVYRNGDLRVSVPGSTRSFSDAGLDPETTYEYRVTAVNGSGTEGDPSNTATATTPAETDGTPPPPPEGLQATAVNPRQVDLTWNPADDPESGISEYRIYRDGSQVGTSATAAFSDTSVEPETEYEYRVSAVNGEGLEGSRSSGAEVVTPAATDPTPPDPPTNLEATATSPTEVNLTWTAASDAESGISEYRIFRDGVQVGTSSATSFTDTAAESGTQYEYAVRAVNGDGLVSDPSAAATVETPAGADTVPPAPPTNLRVVS